MEQRKDTEMGCFIAGNGEPPTHPLPYTMQDVSIQSNTLKAGRDVTLNIIAAVDAPQQDLFPDVRALANWVSPLNHHKIHKDILDKVIEGTGQWVFEHPKFVDWLSGKINVLWGTGIPGAGKTCLTSIIVENLTRNEDATVIYIYCQYNDQLSTTDILACMLKQMIESSEEAARYISTDLQRKCLRTDTQPSKLELLTTLRTAAQQFTQLFLVIDALDELRDDVRPELVELLMSLQQQLFMTSRPLSDVPGLKVPDFFIRAPDHEFRTYILSKISSFPKLEPFLRGPGVREEIVTKVHARCDGMFLLAALQVAALASSGITNARSLQEAVELLPTSLNDRYELTLKRIQGQSLRERDLACRAISLVTYAPCILGVEELLEALTVDIETVSVDNECRTTEETLVNVCMGLVTIEKDSKTVQLIHYTAHEFFKTQREPSVFSDPHAFIANISALYLIHTAVESSAIRSIDDLKATKSSYPFLYYACSHIGHHTFHASSSGKRQIPTQVTHLFRKRPEIPLPLALLGTDVDHVQAIHFAALHGLQSLFEENIEALAQMSVLRCSPLFYACLGGHKTFVEQILADFRASLGVGYETKFGASVLHAASRSGHLGVVELLLPIISHKSSISTTRRLFGLMNVDVNTKMLDGRTALHLASENGYDAVVGALLSYTETRTKGVDGRTVLPALPLARVGCWTTYLPGTKSTGIDINARDRGGRTPLLVSTQNGHHLVVQLLLGSPGIEVNPRSKRSRWTPLHLAAENGHGSIAQLLIDSAGIKVNARTKGGYTPLHKATQNGHDLVIQMLLKSPGIQINPKTNGGWTPLHIAAQDGLQSVAQILLDSTGIDINSKSDDGWTPLHLAAQNGRISMAQMLLHSTGIEVNPKSNSGYTPLHSAAEHGHHSVARLLLDSADIEANPKTNDGWTPLHRAAVNGHELAVQVLMDYAKTEPNARGRGGCTPLHVAIPGGHEPVIRLLLESPNIERNAPVEMGWTPLIMAAYHGYESVVQLLLDCAEIAADAGAGTESGSTSLRVAAENGHEGVVRLLRCFHRSTA